MGTLLVSNGLRVDIPGLGRNQPFPRLSKKRVTRAVREELYYRYGSENVVVACDAMCTPEEWQGACTIAGEQFSYKVLRIDHP